MSKSHDRSGRRWFLRIPFGSLRFYIILLIAGFALQFVESVVDDDADPVPVDSWFSNFRRDNLHMGGKECYQESRINCNETVSPLSIK